MPTYFTSDVHLRLDRPDRSQRFAQWVNTLGDRDQLYIVGDLCDFWFASRQRSMDPWACEGLSALRRFRDRGGETTVLGGNHDGWLGPFYEDVLGSRFLTRELTIDSEDLRIHAVHGHMLGARRAWKGVMESRWFLDAYAILPGGVANGLESLLATTNEKKRYASDLRHLQAYRDYAAKSTQNADIFIYGHIHRPHEETLSSGSRLIVLGSWHEGSGHLCLDGGRIENVVKAAVRNASGS